jgi:hypothetical protein
LIPSLPILEWGRGYDRNTLTSDLMAALIVTVMLIPQGLAYALLAGLPPEVGLYASIAPLVLYAILGTSRVLAVGPVAGSGIKDRRNHTPGITTFKCSPLGLSTVEGVGCSCLIDQRGRICGVSLSRPNTRCQKTSASFR